MRHDTNTGLFNLQWAHRECTTGYGFVHYTSHVQEDAVKHLGSCMHIICSPEAHCTVCAQAALALYRMCGFEEVNEEGVLNESESAVGGSLLGESYFSSAGEVSFLPCSHLREPHACPAGDLSLD